VRAVVIGARRTRQGTGPFVVRALKAAGVEVAGVVASSPESAEKAAADHDAAAPDLVAVCSPVRFHGAHVAAAADAGCHCLCEKPLLWEPGASARDLVDRFEDRLLDVLAQWPSVLPAYLQLYPLAALPPATFAMTLGPITAGAEAVVDSAPHALSLLWAACGPGWVENARAAALPDGAEGLDLGFEYHFGAGTTRARLTLFRTPEPPRPAELSFDGLRARRRVSLPAYRQFLVADDGREVALPDPLALVVADFVRRAGEGARTDRARLVAGQTQLDALVRSCEALG